MNVTIGWQGMLAVVLVSALLSGPTAAQSGASGCSPNRGADQIIGSCTVLIEANKVTKETLHEVFFLRGTAYVEKGLNNRAIEDFDQALKLHPEFAGAYYNRGNAFYKLGKIDRAILDYDRAISLAPNFLEAIHHRGIAYEQIGEKQKAIEDFRLILKTAPSDELARDELKRIGE